MNDAHSGRKPLFYTVPEAAKIMRCAPATIYRALHEDAFPGVRLRTRYVVPARAIDELIELATTGQGCIDVAQMTAQRRTERELARLEHDHAPRTQPPTDRNR